MHPDYLDRVSVFETLRSYRGILFRLDGHWRRLSESCKGIGRKMPLSEPALKEWVRRQLEASGFKNAVLRLSIHWGGSGSGSLVLIIRKWRPLPRRWYRAGIALKTAVPRRWTLRAQDPRIKASQFVGSVLAVLDKTGQDELLFLGSQGFVAEGAVSNLFIVKGKRILTPSVSSGILKGVTRGVVLEAARRIGFRTVETFLTRHEFYTADECFLTNTSSEILPVVRLDGRTIAGGRPGPVTRTLREQFQREVARSTRPNHDKN